MRNYKDYKRQKTKNQKKKQKNNTVHIKSVVAPHLVLSQTPSLPIDVFPSIIKDKNKNKTKNDKKHYKTKQRLMTRTKKYKKNIILDN